MNSTGTIEGKKKEHINSRLLGRDVRDMKGWRILPEAPQTEEEGKTHRYGDEHLLNPEVGQKGLTRSRNEREVSRGKERGRNKLRPGGVDG